LGHDRIDLGPEYAMKNSRILLIEGIPGIGKSALLRAALRRHCCAQGKPRTVLYLTQAHTYGPVAPSEDAGTLTVEENLAHLEGITATIEWYASVVESEEVAKFFGLIDTFHLTHCHRPGVLNWSDVDAVDARLAAIGCRLVVVHGSDETIRTRCIGGRQGTPFIDQYMRRRAGADAGLLDYFRDEQASLLSLARRSRLATLELANDGTPEDVLDSVYEHWMAE
jgi:hypothetical protein